MSENLKFQFLAVLFQFSVGRVPVATRSISWRRTKPKATPNIERKRRVKRPKTLIFTDRGTEWKFEGSKQKWLGQSPADEGRNKWTRRRVRGGLGRRDAVKRLNASTQHVITFNFYRDSHLGIEGTCTPFPCRRNRFVSLRRRKNEKVCTRLRSTRNRK